MLFSKPNFPTAVAVFGRPPVLEARRRGFGPAGEGLFRKLDFSQSVRDRADIHYFLLGSTVTRFTNGEWVHPQEGSAFAQRLENVLETLAGRGYRQVVLIGTDCPELVSADIDIAIGRLRGNNLVLGPDTKGGCYLIGLHLSERRRLSGVAWCRGSDFAELRSRFGRGNTFALERKGDVHTLRDLRTFAATATASRVRAAAALLVSLMSPGVSVRPDRSSLCLGQWVRMMLTYMYAPPGQAGG